MTPVPLYGVYGLRNPVDGHEVGVNQFRFTFQRVVSSTQTICHVTTDPIVTEQSIVDGSCCSAYTVGSNVQATSFAVLTASDFQHEVNP